MYPNEKFEQQHVVVNSPGERRETVTERTRAEGPQEVSLSPGMVAMIILLAVIAICVTVYVVNNRNANEEANRQAMREAAGQPNTPQPPPTVVQQPAQQPPVIIQQPAPTQQAPVIIQQPAQPSAGSSTIDDGTLLELAAKKLSDDPGMAAVSVNVSNARATLTGTVDTAEIKAKAESVVKAIRGVKSVDNKIVVSGQ
ncbi:MAG TPA: BON domain-containing protein [Blastocatellia bacterium]|nr:BON domain-containing protein [Blastocatellia bacterium]